jgi:hypothetical protein
MFFHGLICCELINNFPDAFMWDNYVDPPIILALKMSLFVTRTKKVIAMNCIIFDGLMLVHVLSWIDLL